MPRIRIQKSIDILLTASYRTNPFNLPFRRRNPIAKPQLIIISGPPAAGKSTSARPLADALGYPLLSMDEVKERLADAIGPDATSIAPLLSDAAVQLLSANATELLAASQNVILEGFFQSDRYSATLANLTSLADSVLIHLLASDAELKHRYESRALRGERHWIHGDAEKIGTLQPELPAYMAEILDLRIPQIIIDTTDHSLDLDSMVQLIQQARSDEKHRTIA